MLEDPEVAYLAKQLLKNYHKEPGASVDSQSSARTQVILEQVVYSSGCVTPRKNLVDQRVVLDSLNWLLACSRLLLGLLSDHNSVIFHLLCFHFVQSLFPL